MAETEKKKKKSMPFQVKFAIFCVLVAAVIFLPSTLVFLSCMVPTIVASIIDRNPQRTLWITIGALNLAGTVPAVFGLWEKGHHLDNAISTVTDPTNLLIAYGAAGVGWLVYQNITPFVAAIMVRKNEIRLKEIEKRQKELVRKWGEDVAKFE